MIKSSSKYISLERLLEIQANNYRTKCGQYEYAPNEIDTDIYQKQTNSDVNDVENLIISRENEERTQDKMNDSTMKTIETCKNTSILNKSQDWYNPMQIGSRRFESIQIVDGDDILYKFNWFNRSIGSSNSTNEPIEIKSKLVRSTLPKNKLRYSGKEGNYVLSIDKSLLDFAIADITIANYDYNDTRIETYKLANNEAYFSVRTQLAPTRKQKAYKELADILESEFDGRLSMYDLKRLIPFYNDNIDLCKKAGI